MIEQKLFDSHYKFIELGKGLNITTGEIKDTGIIFENLKDSKDDLIVKFTY